LNKGLIAKNLEVGYPLLSFLMVESVKESSIFDKF